MKLIGTIKEENLTIETIKKERISVRGIILKEDKILLTYSQMFHDYTTPGGGVESGEVLEETLKREIKEEVGGFIKSATAIGYIDEYRTFIDDFRPHAGSVFHQRNYYYLVEIDYFENTHRNKDEIHYGMEARWVYPDEAINQNNSEIERRSKGEVHLVHPYTTLKRENTILKYIKEHLL
ncbi:MAG: NUDIX domain-containing protein [Acholeplasmatales bacterium]|jgi:8-oxo-dGTP pyrophosphatase MutT (NUDIX family)|nr:NUDIX domain-containing protein [Acholeplasmatales bacterium]